MAGRHYWMVTNIDCPVVYLITPASEAKHYSHWMLLIYGRRGFEIQGCVFGTSTYFVLEWSQIPFSISWPRILTEFYVRGFRTPSILIPRQAAFYSFRSLKFIIVMLQEPIPVAARCKRLVCGGSLSEIVGSNSVETIDVCLLWVLCVVR